MVDLTGIVAFDKATQDILIQWQRTWLTRIMRRITCLGSSVVCFPAYILCFAFDQDILSVLAAKAIFAEAIILPVIVFLRYYTKRERPVSCTASPWAPWNRYSFPSHHSARIWMVALVILQYYAYARPLIISIAILVSFSRLYLQKHYTTDVFAGAVVGSLAAALSSAFAL